MIEDILNKELETHFREISEDFSRFFSLGHVKNVEGISEQEIELARKRIVVFEKSPNFFRTVFKQHQDAKQYPLDFQTRDTRRVYFPYKQLHRDGLFIAGLLMGAFQIRSGYDGKIEVKTMRDVNDFYMLRCGDMGNAKTEEERKKRKTDFILWNVLNRINTRRYFMQKYVDKGKTKRKNLPEFPNWGEMVSDVLKCPLVFSVWRERIYESLEKLTGKGVFHSVRQRDLKCVIHNLVSNLEGSVNNSDNTKICRILRESRVYSKDNLYKVLTSKVKAPYVFEGK